MLKKISVLLIALSMTLSLSACAKSTKPATSASTPVCEKSRAIKLQKMTKTDLADGGISYKSQKRQLTAKAVGEGPLIISLSDEQKLLGTLKIDYVDFADFGDAFAYQDKYVIELLTEFSTRFYLINFTDGSLNLAYTNSYLFEKYTPKSTLAKGVTLKGLYGLIDNANKKYILVGTSYKTDCFNIPK